MARFKVTGDYRSNHNGRFFAYDKGTEVDVDPEVAEWVNRDSPGILKPVGGASKSASKSDGDSDGELERPPEVGKGSGTKAWAAYAQKAHGLEFPKGTKKAEIVEAVKAAEDGGGDG